VTQTERQPAGELELVGRITTASNATFLARLDDVAVVYKPTAGERRLWDFPDGTLARREVATYEVSEVLGWHVVPRTWLGDGPFGSGMLQVWCEPTGYASAPAVSLVPSEEAPGDGWCHVLDAYDETGLPVSLLHEDSAPMRRMAVLDVVTNNADRKGAHVLEMADGHRYGVDHGLTFNTEPRLRTILWGWVGEPLEPEEIDGLERLLVSLDGDLGTRLAELVEPEEVAAFAARCERLLRERRFPPPEGDMPAIPWPPL
jgi:uncharacterized repeat protein (TIGR03843 family)